MSRHQVATKLELRSPKFRSRQAADLALEYPGFVVYFEAGHVSQRGESQNPKLKSRKIVLKSSSPRDRVRGGRYFLFFEVYEARTEPTLTESSDARRQMGKAVRLTRRR